MSFLLASSFKKTCLLRSYSFHFSEERERSGKPPCLLASDLTLVLNGHPLPPVCPCLCCGRWHQGDPAETLSPRSRGQSGTQAEQVGQSASQLGTCGRASLGAKLALAAGHLWMGRCRGQSTRSWALVDRRCQGKAVRNHSFNTGCSHEHWGRHPRQKCPLSLHLSASQQLRRTLLKPSLYTG